MRYLLKQYFNIAFLMGKPQDLPAGRAQMQIGVVFAALTYIIALSVPLGVGRALLQASIDLVCTAAVLKISLQMTGRDARFEQAFGGLCGASAFINLAALPIYGLRPLSFGEPSTVMVLADFVLLVWGLSLLGHVIRHTFEINMALSIVVSFVYFVLLSSLIATLLPMPGPPPAELSMLGVIYQPM